MMADEDDGKPWITPFSAMARSALVGKGMWVWEGHVLHEDSSLPLNVSWEILNPNGGLLEDCAVLRPAELGFEVVRAGTCRIGQLGETEESRLDVSAYRYKGVCAQRSRELILGSMDEDVRTTLARAFGDPLLARSRCVNWLCGAPLSDCQGEQADPARLAYFRQQAVLASPLLALLANDQIGDIRHNMRSPWEAIDLGQPLIPMLVSWCLPRWTVWSGKPSIWAARKFLSLRLEDVIGPATPSSSVSASGIMRVLMSVKPDHVPHNSAEWAVALACLKAVIRTDNDGGGEGVQTFLRAVEGRWTDLDVDDVIRTHVPDVAADLACNLIAPLALLEEEGGFFAEHGDPFLSTHLHRQWFAISLLVSTTAAATVETSRLWHARHPAIHDRLGNLHPHPNPLPFPSWDALTQDFTASSGASVRFIADRDALKAEGEAMAHCVATYAPSCMQGHTYIASIRDVDGCRLSTLEVDGCRLERAVNGWKQDEPRLCLRQHQGHGNSRPGALATQAAEEWLGAVVSGRLAVDWNALHAAVRRRMDELHSHGLDASTAVVDFIQAAYDTTAPGALEAAWLEYRSILPRSLRRGGLDGLRACVRAAMQEDMNQRGLRAA
jgi:hypothetical protein